MMLQVAVNGDRSKADHPVVPVTAEELARDARECLAAGAQEFHVHVRDDDGHPTLEPGYVDAAVSAMHAAGAHVVGVTTVADIEPDLRRRLDLVSRWTRPCRARRSPGGRGRRRLDTRVGLEDTVYLPDGSRAPGNAALVWAARDLGAGQLD
jgi:uncharacterized protein (DUF849 family)